MRVFQYGVGAMGSLMVQLLQSRSGVSIVAAVDSREGKIGKDIGDVAGLGRSIGVTVRSPHDIDAISADVALHATTAFSDEAHPILSELISRGMNIVTITQELFFPIGRSLEIAADLDRQAKQAGVRVTAVGINPGFILDVLPIVSSLPCWSVERVTGRRVVDFSAYGPDEMVHIGAGLSEEEFVEGAAKGKVGHIGLIETSAMVAHALDLGIDELIQTKAPLVSERPRNTSFVTIESGRVCGFRQSVKGLAKGEEKLYFEMIGLLAPTEGDPEMGDRFRIFGTPSIDVVTKEEISQRGGLGTAAVTVNTIPRLLQAEPGFHTCNQLVMPSIWRSSRDGGYNPKVSTTVERC